MALPRVRSRIVRVPVRARVPGVLLPLLVRVVAQLVLVTVQNLPTASHVRAAHIACACIWCIWVPAICELVHLRGVHLRADELRARVHRARVRRLRVLRVF